VVRADANTLIDALGRRDPAAGTAPTRFRTATILVTRDALASPDMMSFYSYMTERAEWRTRVLTHGGFAKETGQPFFVATGERGTLEVHLERGLADIELTPSTATTGESSAESSAGLQIKVASRSSIAPTAPVTFECSGLPAGASCTFEPATVTATPAGHTATLTINAGVAAVRGSYEIVVKAQAGDARHSTALTLVVAK
jgi:hypothetical protein